MLPYHKHNISLNQTTKEHYFPNNYVTLFTTMHLHQHMYYHVLLWSITTIIVKHKHHIHKGELTKIHITYILKLQHRLYYHNLSTYFTPFSYTQ